MALTKTLRAFTDTGQTLYVIVIREADGYFLNDADGSFAAAPADPFLALAEDATIKGLYSVAEARSVWADGGYLALVYGQVGGSPATASDEALGIGTLALKDDAEVELSDISINTQGIMVLFSRLNASVSHSAKDVIAAFETGLGKIRPAILDLQKSLHRGRK